MDASAKTTNKQEKNDVIQAAAIVEESEDAERKPAGKTIAITVLARDQKWQFHIYEDQPLSGTLFIPLESMLEGKCMLHYQSAKVGQQILDPTKTPSFYGMIYDDLVYLGAVIRASD